MSGAGKKKSHQPTWEVTHRFIVQADSKEEAVEKVVTDPSAYIQDEEVEEVG